MQLIDLSLEISPNQSEPINVEIEYINHRQGAEMLGKSAGLKAEDFPDGLGLSLELVKLTTHTGTHIDAPIHYGPLSEGDRAKNISELPLEWFYSDGVVIDCSKDVDSVLITEEEIKIALKTIRYTLKPKDIVLIKTGADKLWRKKEYFTQFRGMSREATSWLVQQGIKVIGIDTFGFDAPFAYMLDKYNLTKDKSYLWPAHCFGREKEYCQIERLTNLDNIPVNYGFKVSCFPIKIQSCGAGWSRVVAMIGENHD